MTFIKSISFDEKTHTNPKFGRLIDQRQLSKTICDLLKAYWEQYQKKGLEKIEGQPAIKQCPRCGYQWIYKGKNKWNATCPDCKRSVKIGNLIPL